MANDIDMWNDIADLEKTGRKKEAEAMSEVYTAWFIEGSKKKAKKAIKTAWKRFPKFHFGFSNYGIDEPRMSMKKLKKVV
jgi:hypothetical protein